MKKILFPNFLTKIDKHLLLNYPLVWSSKIHYVAWFTILGWLILMPFAFFTNPNELESDFVGVYWTLASISIIVLTIVWLNNVFRHNATKQFGKRTTGREWVNLICHYLCLLLISSVLYAYPALTFLKSKAILKSNHTVEKVNQLNIGQVFFPTENYGFNPIYEETDTLQQNVKGYQLSCDNYTYGYYKFHKFDSDYITNYDSAIVKKVLSFKGNSLEIEKTIENYLKVVKQYGFSYPYSAKEVIKFVNSDFTYNRNLEFESANSSLHTSLDRAIDEEFAAIRHYSFIFDADFYFGWLACFLPCLLIILTIYRNVSIKFFFISIGVTILLTILNALFFSVFSSNHVHSYSYSYYDSLYQEKIILGLFSFWFVLLLGLSLVIFRHRIFSRFHAYAVFLLNLLLPFLPVIFMALFLQFNECNHYSDYGVRIQTDCIPYKNQEFYMKMSVYFSLILLFITQQLFFKKLYERIHALPQL